MTKNNFILELKDLSDVFEKQIPDAYVKRLYQKLEALTIAEFRAIRARVEDECEFFPRLAKWAQLKDWILAKRNSGTIASLPIAICKNCLGCGYVRILDRNTKTLVLCDCDMAKIQPSEGLPTLSQISTPIICLWDAKHFIPSANETRDTVVDRFLTLVKSARSYWAQGGDHVRA